MRHAPLRRYEFSKYSFAFWQENRIRALTDYISMSRFWLPLITVLPFPREQVFHNRCNDTAVGNNADILFDFRECFQHPHFHLRTTFTSGRDVGFVVTGKPGLVLGNVFQLIVALISKIPKSTSRNSGISLKGTSPNRMRRVSLVRFMPLVRK